ncbi:DUF6090 family protein [Winogradskyella sp. PE311]|uniref:DUF6090 family protein n=1 Tax=Winogradskyella sp. PE311 TaxID=3366943 RepID=UPI003980B5FE
MIKLFRKFRKKTLNENKTQRYFKYALGEIILVVIGILIALQINTWNENRKATNEEVKILTALNSDFEDSKKRIEETMVMQNKVMDYSQVLIDIHERQDPKDFEYLDKNLDSLDYLISYGTSWYRAEPVTGAYKSLISAGKIDLIQNEDLRHLLAQFSADLESGFEDHEISMQILDKLIDDTSDFILKIASNKFRDRLNYKPRQIKSAEISESFFSKNRYFGNLYLKSILEENRITRQQLMLDQTNAILSIINKELNKK